MEPVRIFMTWRTPPYAIHRFQSGPFERTSKRRNGFASESRVKRGQRVVHGDKELLEKLGRNDPCPCGSGRRFQAVLLARWSILTVPRAMSISANSSGVRAARANKNRADGSSISTIRAWRNRQPRPASRAVESEGSCTFESCRPDRSAKIWQWRKQAARRPSSGRHPRGSATC